MVHPRRISIMLLLIILFSLFWLSSVAAVKTNKTIVQLTIVDAIGPATADYVQRSLAAAQKLNAELVIIQLDTPGGLDTSMRDIIKSITTSPFPIVTYVSPSGARAASAGTYILYASHIAAMAPGTNLGAATPVQIGGGLPTPDTAEDEDEKDKSNKDKSMSTMERKIINDAVAYIKGLAALHGRNEKWAEKAVREGASLPASEALKLNVIDLIATDQPNLLKQLEGRKVNLQGHPYTITTTGLPITKIDPDWRSRFLSVITNPNVAYILMLLGMYGLILEFSNPGAIVPGTVGAICLLLALYSFQLLPINYAGFALILLGIALMVGEAFEPSFGILGIGGLVAFVIGSIILMDTTAPGFGIDISIIITFALSSVLIFIVVFGMAFKARKRAIFSGLEQFING
jgi:membrane-bound serine protease (ClpP class)